MGIGWGKPVPVSPYRFRLGPRLGSGVVALAGPAANLLVAAILGLGLRLGLARWQWLQFVVISLGLTNIVLAMFNLLPLPPLDGHSVLLGLLSLSRAQWAWRTSQFLLSLRRYGPMLLILLIVATQFLGINLIGWLIGPPARFFYRSIVGWGA